MNISAPVIVFGESSASIFLIQELICQQESVIWVNGSGSRLIPVMPYVKSEKALAALVNAQKSNKRDEDSDNQLLERGIFHRVFRNKAFKLPSWKRATSLSAQEDAFSEMVWKPEQAFLGLTEFRISGITPTQIETELRSHFDGHPLVKRIQSNPLVEFEVLEQGGKVQFADGFVTAFKQFYFCDSLNELRSIPKLRAVFKHPLSGLKASSQMNALQVVFHHSAELNQSIDVGFVIPLNRDAGESFDRDVLGYFLDARTSVWTVFLQPSECEENHDIMKKLRKLKQSLNRAFESREFLPEGKTDFLSTVEKEQFRYEENCLMTEGALKASQSNPDFVLLPDAFGLTKALETIADRFGIIEAAQAESVDQTVGPESDPGAPDL